VIVSGQALAERFEILRRVGAGGMGEVYEAFDRERRERVALKTLTHADPHTLTRFKREFRALQGLAHPNLVSLGELVRDDERWFFTMELVEGRHFLEHVRGGDLDEPALRDALGQLVRGLRVLHDAGLVHRDVKPSNVLVEHGDRAVLIDLGVALDRRAPSLTPADVVAGTPGLMAPEHERGTRVDPRSDLYQVGVILLHALTGVDGGTIDAVERDRLTAQQPPALAAVLARALAAAPDDRFPDAATMQAALLHAALRR
jgi:serine/threonine protein kinase